jgi:hypothetical protein
MTITRRKFMKAGILAAACAGIPLKAQFANSQEAVGSRRPQTPPAITASSADQADILSYYNQSTFAPYVNTEFRVRVDELKVRKITLVEVKGYAGASRPETAGEECFSLFFTAPSSSSFKQNTYEVEHAALGKFSLFLVPVGMRSGGKQYFEAAFNRCNQDASYGLGVPPPLR